MFCRLKAELQLFLGLLVAAGTLGFLARTIQPVNGSFAPAFAPNSNTGQTLYFPIISYSPSPTPLPVLFRDDFSNKRSGWPRNENGRCRSFYHENAYVTIANPDQQCYYKAPDKAEARWGQFEVKAKHGLWSTNFIYGLYINADDDLDRYYLFEVDYFPKDKCTWQLTKKSDEDRSQQLAEGDCRSVSHGFGRFNRLKLSHSPEGVITAYLNNTPLGAFIDPDPLSGRGAGLFAEEEADDDGVILVFDNFTVYRP